MNYFGIFFTFIILPMTGIFAAIAAAYFDREEGRGY